MERRKKPTVSLAQKKSVYMILPFKGDIQSELFRRKLKHSLGKAFPAAELHLTFKTKKMFYQNSKDELPSFTASSCIYKFNCSCGASYVGRTTRNLSKRIHEHLPTWWLKGQHKSINSSILAHLMDTGHHIDPDKAFTILLMVSKKLPKSIRFKILCTAEAVTIDSLKPELCVQKNHLQALCLP